MRTITRNVGTLAELKAVGGRPYQRAIERLQSRVDADTHTQDEIVDSLKAFVAAIGCRLQNYSIGTGRGGDYVSVAVPDLDYGDDGEMLTDYRQFITDRLEAAGYWDDGKLNTTGLCKFTGVCWDDCLVEAFWKALPADGVITDTQFTGAMQGLGSDCQRMIEEDNDYNRGEEAIEEMAEANDYEFDMATGEMV